MKSLVNSFEEAKYIKASVESSERSTELSTLQYEEGLVDYQRVLDSIRSLTVRQDELARTKGDIATNAIGLYKAFGGGWDIDYRDDLLLPEETISEMADRTDWGNFLDTKGDDDE